MGRIPWPVALNWLAAQLPLSWIFGRGARAAREDLPLLAEHAVLTPQLPQLLLLAAVQPFRLPSSTDRAC